MKKILVIMSGVLFPVLFLSGCVGPTSNNIDESDAIKIARDAKINGAEDQNIKNNFTEGETDANQFEAPDLKFKKIGEKGVYEDESVKFSLNFESPLAAQKCSATVICVHNERSSRPSLEGGDFEVTLYLNQSSDSVYNNLLADLTSQSYKMGGDISPMPYPFSLADSAREKEVDVQLVKYSNEKLDVYFLYWKDNGKKDFVVIRDNKFDFPKRNNDLDAIVQTIELK